MSIDALSSESEREQSLAPPGAAGAVAKLTTLFSSPNAPLAPLAMLLVVLFVATAGALWAIDSGVSAPLAVMVGYCTVTSTIALYAATRTLRRTEVEQAQIAVPAHSTSEAWKLVSTLTVSDASRLWCDIEPGTTATQESMAWGRALLDAIKRGELPIVVKAGMTHEAVERERENPHYMSQVNRDALQAWANGHGYAPNFLR